MKTTKKELKLKLSAAVTMAVLIGIVALGLGIVKAYQGSAPKVVIENGNFIEAQELPPVEEQNIGASSQDTSGSNHLNVNGFDEYVLVGKMGNGLGYATTTVSFTDPFETATTTSGDVVINQVTSGFGYTGATSTVTLVEISGIATTTAFEFDCTGAATPYATSTPAILNTESAIGASNRFLIRSGMTSSTNPGGGSYVVLSTQPFLLTDQILLTPAKPYLVCKVWHTSGGSLSAFTDSAGTAAVQVTAFISRQR